MLKVPKGGEGVQKDGVKKTQEYSNQLVTHKKVKFIGDILSISVKCN
jgi:hypothetical protein